MLHKIKAVVLKTVKYRESSVVTTLYTDRFGIKTYILNGVRTKKPKYSMAFFQPLSLLEIVVYNKENANINRISELRSAAQFATIPYNATKIAQTLFLSELLNKLIKEEHPSYDLFQYIFNSVELFDNLNENFQNFHLQFLLKLSKYLGFAAESYHPLIRDNFDQTQGQLLADLLRQPFDQSPVLSSENRSDLLDDILRFYRNQTDTSMDLKSLKVFRSITF